MGGKLAPEVEKLKKAFQGQLEKSGLK